MSQHGGKNLTMLNNESGKETWRYDPDRKDLITDTITAVFDKRRPSTAEELTSALKEVCNVSLTKRYPRNKREGKRWWSKNIEAKRQTLLNTRRQLTRANKITKGSPSTTVIQNFWEAYTAFKLEKQRAKSLLHKRLCEELNQNPWGDAYRTAMSGLRPRKRATIPNKQDQIIAQLFPTHDPMTFNEIPDDGYENFSLCEIKQAAAKLKCGKSPGSDGIPAEVVALAALTATDTIRCIMNNQLRTGIFPTIWKEAALTLIPKDGNSEMTPKYRPICLISAIGKLLEHLLNARLNKELQRTGGLSAKQHAFTSRKSCATALEATTRFMEETKRKGTSWTPAIILLDVTNAFNSARWDIILTRLRQIKVKEYIIGMIKSYFTDRSLHLGGKQYLLSSGVPQGSVLGPTLWNVLIDPVTEVQLPDYCDVTLYADDIAILIAAKDGPSMAHRGNLAMKRIKMKLQHLGLEIAPQKTNALIARGKRTSIPVGTKFVLSGQDIYPTNFVRYLGVTFDSDLSFTQHAERTSAGATSALNALSAILSTEHTRMARRRIIARVIEAKLTYGCEVWAHRIAAGALERLEGVQKRAAVRITRGLAKMNGEAALVLAGMVPLAIQIRTRHEKFVGRKKATATEIVDMWQARWKANTCWTRTLIPDLRPWVTRRHGEVCSAIAEVLSGQGHFGTYLKLVKKRPSSNCCYCGTPETLRHLLLHCPRFDKERTRAGLQAECDVRSIVRKMLTSPEEWHRIESLAKRIREEGIRL